MAQVAAASAPSAPARWLRRMPRKLKFTREGKYFVGVTLGVGLAAINTANNLLYLVLGLQLSLIIVSGILSELTLRDLDIVRRLPTRAEAGRTFLVEISLVNRKKHAPSYSVEVEDLLTGRATEKRCYFLKVSASGAQTAAYRCTLPVRGAYRFRGFRVCTRFPFGLFEKSREVDFPDELVVLPRLVPVRPPVPGQALSLGDDSVPRPGLGSEFYGLRAFRPGDDSRDIHWKTSARKGDLLVREREADRGREVVLALDNALPPGDLDQRVDAAMEEAVSIAASLATDYTRRGMGVSIAVRGEVRPAVQGERALQSLLRWLALLPILPSDGPLAFPPLPQGTIGIAHRRSVGLPPLAVNFRCG